jgi:hypothetical protein
MPLGVAGRGRIDRSEAIHAVWAGRARLALVWEAEQAGQPGQVQQPLHGRA